MKNVKLRDRMHMFYGSDDNIYFQCIDEFGTPHYYRTHWHREGLDALDTTTGEYHQIMGTCDFALEQETRSGVYRAVVRFFKRAGYIYE